MKTALLAALALAPTLSFGNVSLDSLNGKYIGKSGIFGSRCMVEFHAYEETNFKKSLFRITIDNITNTSISYIFEVAKLKLSAVDDNKLILPTYNDFNTAYKTEVTFVNEQVNRVDVVKQNFYSRQYTYNCKDLTPIE